MVGLAMLFVTHSTTDWRALCSVPLCYVYPAMLHYKACARTWKQKVADIALGVFGMAAAVYTTVQTVAVSRISLFLFFRRLVSRVSQ